MCRSALIVAAGLLTAAGLAQAADPVPPSGFWKLNVPLGREGDLMLMVAFTEQDGKWVGDYLTSSVELRAQPKLTNLSVKGDAVRFSLEFAGREFISFDGSLSKDKKKIAGSVSVGGGPLQLAELLPTKLKKLDDPFEIVRETLTQMEGGPELFETAAEVISRAAAKKLPLDEVQGILDRVNKAAGDFGSRWEREVALRLATVLASQEGFRDLAVAQAKRAERMLTDDDENLARMRVLQAVATALSAAGKPEDAKAYQAQITKLEARDYAEYAKGLPFKPEPFAGRKMKSDRSVLVEVFTGAECPPCAAVDLAFDGLMKTYKPTDVVLLQYHFHVPQPDALTSPDGMKRASDYYGEQIEGAPTIFVAGKVAAPGGGPASAAGKKYLDIRTPIEEALEKAPGVKLSLAVTPAEKGGFTAKATVADLAMPGEKMTLRFALAEERVRYPGGNGIRYHHMVVRSMPGGTAGFPLTKATAEQTVTISPAEVRAALQKYLTDFERDQGSFPRTERPLDLRNLKVVAFVQNDMTREVLTAVQADLP